MRQNSGDYRAALNLDRSPVGKSRPCGTRSLGGARSRRSRRSPRSRPRWGGTRREDEPEEAASDELQEGQVALAGVDHAPVLVAAQLCARSLMDVENVTCQRSSSVTDSIPGRPSSLSILSTTADGGPPSEVVRTLLSPRIGRIGPNGATTGGGLTFSRWYMNAARKSATSMKPRNCDTG